jgi:hypothetical protein
MVQSPIGTPLLTDLALRFASFPRTRETSGNRRGFRRARDLRLGARAGMTEWCTHPGILNFENSGPFELNAG